MTAIRWERTRPSDPTRQHQPAEGAPAHHQASKAPAQRSGQPGRRALQQHVRKRGAPVEHGPPVAAGRDQAGPP